MQIGLILLALAFPLLELAVLIKVGQQLGVWWTILVLVATIVAGGLIVQSQGLNAARRAAESMQEGRPPIEPVVDSFMLMLAGFLLLVPGFLSDGLALLLLIPPVRRGIAKWTLRRMFSGADVRVETHEWRSPARGGSDDASSGPGRPSRSGQVIDVEWEPVEDTRPRPKPPEDERK